MTSPSAAPAFIDKLAEVFADAVDVEVHDGQPLVVAEQQGYVAVGWDGVDSIESATADIDQQLVYAGSTVKNEEASVQCVAVSWSGGTEFKPERDLAMGYLSDCEQALRAAIGSDPDLQGYTLWQVSAGSIHQSREAGCKVRVPFTVTYAKQI